MKQVIGSSHAKVILIGDHSVVYKKPAIALPLLNVKTTAEIIPLRNSIQIISSRYYSGIRQEAPVELEGINILIDTLLTQFHGLNNAFELKICSDIPIERGMGSSAAIAVAIIRAFYHSFENRLSHKQLQNSAYISEHIIHGNSSGLDVSATISDTAIWFHKGDKTIDIPLHISGYIVIADSGIHKRTSLTVRQVAEFKKTHSYSANHVLNHLNYLTKSARSALIKNDLLRLGKILNKAQEDLKILGVSHPRLDQMIYVSRQNGAIGAKLTGGGMGGCIIAIAKNNKDVLNITQSLKQMNISKIWIQSFNNEESIYEDGN